MLTFNHQAVATKSPVVASKPKPKAEPFYLLTKEGYVWVRCCKCSRPIPIWQADDNGEETTAKRFTCPWDRKEGHGEKPLPVPEFVNVKK